MKLDAQITEETFAAGVEAVDVDGEVFVDNQDGTVIVALENESDAGTFVSVGAGFTPDEADALADHLIKLAAKAREGATDDYQVL